MSALGLSAHRKRCFSTILLAAGLLAAGPAVGGSPPVVVYFAGTADDAAQSLASLCVAKGIPVIEQDSRHVQCASEVSGLSGALTQMLIGNAYSTTPLSVVRFSIVPAKGYAAVQAVQWVETQMAFGQVRRTTLDGRKQTERLRAALIAAGGSLTPPAVSPIAQPLAPAAPAEPQPAPIVAPVPKPPAKPTTEQKSTPRPAVRCITCSE